MKKLDFTKSFNILLQDFIQEDITNSKPMDEWLGKLLDAPDKWLDENKGDLVPSVLGIIEGAKYQIATARKVEDAATKTLNKCKGDF